MQKYVTIYNGFIRELGDEVRTKTIPANGCYEEKPASQWAMVSLVGHEILRSDLIHLDFRRPV